MFSLSFHTGYVSSNRLKLRRLELDRANKDGSHKHFAPHFVVSFFFLSLTHSFLFQTKYHLLK
jgi:C2 domain of PTEN tumour-suppressor protein